MHGVHLHKMSQWDAMARDPRQDLLGRDRDILLQDWDETRDVSVQDWDETETLRILSKREKNENAVKRIQQKNMLASSTLDWLQPKIFLVGIY